MTPTKHHEPEQLFCNEELSEYFNSMVPKESELRKCKYIKKANVTSGAETQRGDEWSK